jgi:hypothetical protein
MKIVQTVNYYDSNNKQTTCVKEDRWCSLYHKPNTSKAALYEQLKPTVVRRTIDNGFNLKQF